MATPPLAANIMMELFTVCMSVATGAEIPGPRAPGIKERRN